MMLHRIAHLLLVAAVVSSGVSAPFLHVHAHGPDDGLWSSHGEPVDEHCAHHHAHGAHWHLTETPAPDAGDAVTVAAPRHRHAAVMLSAAAVETSTVRLAASVAPVEAPAAGIVPGPCGMRTPVDPTAGPDPPPAARDTARAPPGRS